MPPSAGANQLFRGFSYVDPTALTEVPEVSLGILVDKLHVTMSKTFLLYSFTCYQVLRSFCPKVLAWFV